ncbi:lipoprotein [Bordetella ansorpii]|uniref:Lipoprotein n=1 Tax=Bordetella ansorpii TaxID=288768 RepID=A0A157MLV9_9BORD|nr:lipoprotein [Bordetella ansorpii]
MQWARMLGAMGCVAVMAGCANSPSNGPRADAYLYEDSNEGGIDRYDGDWTASNDPIGDLVSQKLGRKSEAHRALSRTEDNPLVGEALTQLGVRYRFGGSSPDTGFDCSGLVQYSAERSLGLKLPRNAAEIAGRGTSIARSELRPGDLVFFNTMGRRFSHVGIYMGDDRFVHSPSAGGRVRIEDMKMAYWNKRYNGARRISSTNVASARAD